MNLLLVIDLQNDFINEYTESSINEIRELINSKKYDKVLFTRFINSSDNPTHTKLNYKGCFTDEGISICIDTKDNLILDKGTYSAYNQELINYLKDNKISDIYICGIDIECCVLATAYNLFENNYNVYVLKDYVYSMYGLNRKENAIEILRTNIGDKYII